MRAATLCFNFEQMQIIKGIKVSRKDDTEKIHLFANKGRELELPIMIDDPPLIVHQDEKSGERMYFLARCSLNTDGKGGLYAPREREDGERVLLFIDTRDDGAPRRNYGEYTLPLRHDVRLPSLRTSKHLGFAKYGLIVCAPLESYVVRSTSGYAVKVTLGSNGIFTAVAHNAQNVVFPN